MADDVELKFNVNTSEIEQVMQRYADFNQKSMPIISNLIVFNTITDAVRLTKQMTAQEIKADLTQMVSPIGENQHTEKNKSLSGEAILAKAKKTKINLKKGWQ